MPRNVNMMRLGRWKPTFFSEDNQCYDPNFRSVMYVEIIRKRDAIHVLQIRPITFVYANMNNLHSAWVR